MRELTPHTEVGEMILNHPSLENLTRQELKHKHSERLRLSQNSLTDILMYLAKQEPEA